MNEERIPKAKPEYINRINKLLTNKEDSNKYWEILKKPILRSIRANLIKSNPQKLKQTLEQKNWKVTIPWKNHNDIMIIENELEPGELGRALEHLLGYYYIQELASMLPVLSLDPKPNDLILDLCAAPGSKTSQFASYMNNTGTIIANEVSIGRIKILASNLERLGVSNTIITKKDGVALCKKLHKYIPNLNFDKILVDAPCSGEGTLRSSQKTYLMWNLKTIKNLPKLQSELFLSAFELLKIGGSIVYSTCTHAPEENEGVVSQILYSLKDRIKIKKPNLPLKYRPGLTKWLDSKYHPNVKECARIYPHDNNTEGFFVSLFEKTK